MLKRYRLLLAATASALAISAATADAAVVFSSNTPGATTQGFVAGTYEIIVSGAQGGSANYGSYSGGAGATVWGTFHLASPGTFGIVVGGQGANGGDGFIGPSFYAAHGGGGGGGGSFVFIGSTVLAVAGGGGGAGANTSYTPGMQGQSGSGSGLFGRGGAAGATLGGYSGNGGGGGGFSKAGDVGTPVGNYGNGAGGGQAGNGTAFGGAGGQGATAGGTGGFGGGGGGGGAGAYVYYSHPTYNPDTGESGYITGYYTHGGYGSGGGGGGFRGGTGGDTYGQGGRGGYSYLGNVLPGTGYRYGGGDFIQRFNALLGYGNGAVSINLLSADPTGIPEPASMGLFGLSLAGLALARRRGRR